MAASDTPKDDRPGNDARSREEERIRRQSERIREMERLMRAAAAFARGKPPR
ncbi:hypothetical protein HHL28_16380 [Aerophototrophica crusticola]|uniref:Uncharacterized protein n=1 Tax=Aerophototrophica crusticola TaxID=1709002 RepID=A0A858RAM1_9PROT|nr:hypothetical protein HHL28_16380 [Rhodospirillaceae bacterium B3]